MALSDQRRANSREHQDCKEIENGGKDTSGMSTTLQDHVDKTNSGLQSQRLPIAPINISLNNTCVVESNGSTILPSQYKFSHRVSVPELWSRGPPHTTL